ncbi:uncharacterized protein LOC144124772 isoform X1 [Amblyomma americanum]
MQRSQQSKMNAATAITFFALATVALAASLKREEINNITAVPEKTDDDSLRKTGAALEVLGKVLQEKELSADTEETLADVVGALQLLSGSAGVQEDFTSEYFWKKIRRAVENVAKVVVVNKVVGAVASTIG